MRNSMTQQRRFTKEFEEEAVRLVRTSGRTQRAIAEDLGIGLSPKCQVCGKFAGVDRLPAPARIYAHHFPWSIQGAGLMLGLGRREPAEQLPKLFQIGVIELGVVFP